MTATVYSPWSATASALLDVDQDIVLVTGLTPKSKADGRGECKEEASKATTYYQTSSLQPAGFTTDGPTKLND